MPRKQPDESQETFSEEETARRFEEMLRVGLNTPAKPHAEMKIRKSPEKTTPRTSRKG